MEFILIVLLTLLNGAFAMSEMALTASRKARLAVMVEGEEPGAQAAMDGPAGEMTERGAYSYYVRTDSQPIILMLQRKPEHPLVLGPLKRRRVHGFRDGPFGPPRNASSCHRRLKPRSCRRPSG